jgi:CheY-like chemotaxis protein
VGGVDDMLAAVRILIVDDDSETCELLQRLLEGYGARVRTSTSAADALLRIDHETPDVLVSDITMPDRDGYDLVREIRRRPLERGGGVPAIALTALDGAEDKRAALTAGFQLHLRKPVEPETLVSAVAGLARAS